MTRAELDTVLSWAATEGWNPGLDDAEAFYATDSGGFFVAEVDGHLAAAISVVNHSDSFAFLGLYICAPPFRGKGIAYGLWQHALRHAGNRTVGLDGVQDQQDNYAKSGFVLTGETLRFEGTIPGATAETIRPALETDIGRLIQLEAEANGTEKATFLGHWLKETPTRQTIVSDTGDGPRGFATLRKCQQDHKIGPLVASSVSEAKTLIHACSDLAKGPVIIDLPDACPALRDYCQSLGMTASFGTARMYLGRAVESGSNSFAVATLELG